MGVLIHFVKIIKVKFAINRIKMNFFIFLNIEDLGFVFTTGKYKNVNVIKSLKLKSIVGTMIFFILVMTMMRLTNKQNDHVHFEW